jgi:hypothetical protein
MNSATTPSTSNLVFNMTYWPRLESSLRLGMGQLGSISSRLDSPQYLSE